MGIFEFTNVYELPYYTCIQGLLLTLNDFKIMDTLCVYFEYIKVLCKIFIKYIATILQVYTSYVIILTEIITNAIYYYYYYLLSWLNTDIYSFTKAIQIEIIIEIL